jgi:hypothetical protein
MRIRTLATLALVTPLTACASKNQAVSTDPLAQCPFKVVATVGNQSNHSYDVYYYDGAKRQILGEVSARSTVTFSLPGEGRGSVRLFGSQTAGGGIPADHTTRIRIHCEGG